MFIINSCFALNLGLQISPHKEEFTNEENVIIDANIINYELFNSTEQAKLIIKANDLNMTKDIGTLKADQNTTTTFNLGKLPAKSYPATAYIEYDFLGVTDKTQTQNFIIRVIPSKPIEMDTYKSIVTEVIIPPIVEINKEFEITIKIENKSTQLKAEISVNADKSSYNITTIGETEISKKIILTKEGINQLEISLSENGILQNRKSLNIVASNPNNYKKVETAEIQMQKPDINVQAGAPTPNIIDQIGCFVVGGCNPDRNAPIVFIDVGKSDTGYLFKISADDSKTGNSTINNCFIRLGHHEWLPIEGKYGSTKIDINYFTNNFNGNDVVQVQCQDAYGNFGLKTVGVSEIAEVLIISKNIDSKLQKTLSEFAFAIKEDGLSVQIIDLSNYNILKHYGVEKTALTDWKSLKEAVAKFVSVNKSKYVIFVGNEEEIPVPKIEINGTEIKSDVIYGFLEGDGKSFTKPTVIISRILGKFSDSQTSAEDIESLLAQFTQQHIDHSEDTKNKITPRRIVRILWNTAKVICANPALRELSKDVSCAVAAGATGGTGAAACPTIRLCVDGGCFIIGNYDTLSKVVDALQSDPDSRNEKLNQLIKDGSLILVAKDGLLLISGAADIGLIDQDIGEAATNIYDLTTKAQKTYNLVTKIELSAEKLKNKRYGDIIQDAINEIRQTKNLDLTNLPVRDADAEILTFSMQIINGDPTLFVGGK